MEPDPIEKIVLEDVHEKHIIVLLLLKITASHQVNKSISANIVLVRSNRLSMS